MTTKNQLIKSLEVKFEEYKIKRINSFFKFYINKKEYRLRKTTVSKEGYRIFYRSRIGRLTPFTNLRKETILEFHKWINRHTQYF